MVEEEEEGEKEEEEEGSLQGSRTQNNGGHHYHHFPGGIPRFPPQGTPAKGTTSTINGSPPRAAVASLPRMVPR